MQLQDLIHILCSEAAGSREELLVQAAHLGSLDETVDAEALEAAAQAYADFCQRTAAATESIGLAGLSRMSAALADGVVMAAALPVELRAPAAPLLQRWPDFFIAYLEAWGGGVIDASAVAALLADVASAEYLTPLGEAERAELGALLLTPPALADQQAVMVPPWQPLTDEALDLSVPEDADPATLEGLLDEGPLLVQRLGDIIGQLARGQVAPDQLELAHRHAHTLKGTAAIAGIRGVATLAHALEDVMEMFRGEDFAAPDGLNSLMLGACEQLEAAFDHVQNQAPVPEGFADMAHALHAWASSL